MYPNHPKMIINENDSHFIVTICASSSEFLFVSSSTSFSTSVDRNPTTWSVVTPRALSFLCSTPLSCSSLHNITNEANQSETSKKCVLKTDWCIHWPGIKLFQSAELLGQGFILSFLLLDWSLQLFSLGLPFLALFPSNYFFFSLLERQVVHQLSTHQLVMNNSAVYV